MNVKDDDLNNDTFIVMSTEKHLKGKKTYVFEQHSCMGILTKWLSFKRQTISS